MDEIIKKFKTLWKKSKVAAILYLVCSIVLMVLAAIYLSSCTQSLFVQKNSPSATISTETKQSVSADSASIDIKPFNPIN
nr:MAG TPA: hypothetical protein [Microviridae sp.]